MVHLLEFVILGKQDLPQIHLQYVSSRNQARFTHGDTLVLLALIPLTSCWKVISMLSPLSAYTIRTLSSRLALWGSGCFCNRK